MTLVLAAIAVAAGAAAQSVSGIGFALVGGPLLFTVFGAREGVRVAVVLSMLVNIGVLAREHRAVMWRRVLPVLVTALAATPLLVHLLADAHPRVLRAAAGVVIVVGAALVAAGRTADTGVVGGVVAGLASATMNVLASAGGPAVAVYAAGARWDPGRVRATLQAYFLALNVVTLATLGLPHWSAGQAAVLVGCLLAGSAAGAWMVGRVSPTRARTVTLALAAAGGLGVLISAVSG
ncbi:MAG TPA: TSUP family transporter [Mycobacteriales bacterium]|nr:TSUP family transporter [Mycobacteriales bacterium]